MRRKGLQEPLVDGQTRGVSHLAAVMRQIIDRDGKLDGRIHNGSDERRRRRGALGCPAKRMDGSGEGSGNDHGEQQPTEHRHSVLCPGMTVAAAAPPTPLPRYLTVVLFACLVGCKHSTSDAGMPTSRASANTSLPAPSASSVPTPSAESATSPSASTAPSAATAPGSDACVIARSENIDDDGGKASDDGTTRLENARVQVDGDSTIVTWERQSDFKMGDSWRAPWLSIRRGTGTFGKREMPVRAYACATSGRAAPLSAAEPFVTWGQNNSTAFEIWRDLPTLTGPQGMETVSTPAARTLTTPTQSVRTLVANGNFALASTFDCAAPEPCAAACANPVQALWLFGIGPRKTKPVKLGTAKTINEQLVPALAISDVGALAAYRLDTTIYGRWIATDGVPLGKAFILDEGDVGAPALAMSGTRALAVWVKRVHKSGPYELRWLPLEYGKTESAEANAWITPGSAFAPAALLNGNQAVVAWMEGDGAARGTIFASRVSLADGATLRKPVRVSTEAESNARDPELAGPIDTPTLIYSTFSKTRPGGLLRLAQLACPKAPAAR